MEKKRRSSYNKINEEVRMEIIERILRNGESIKEVSTEMGVNISTCKAILKVYQEEGRVGKKKQRNKVLNVI
jgi:transposase